MSADTDIFVDWEERNIRQDKGKREVHYFLKRESGDLLLAVVGKEKSIRHMNYVVAEDYLQAYGSEGFINAGTKWRARREVVDWLTSMVSKHHGSGDTSNMLTSNSTQAPGSSGGSMTDNRAPLTHLPDDMIQVPRTVKVESSDIVWSGVDWVCSKKLRHYSAFRRNETTIAVHSFVFVMGEEESHYVGYLEDLYEDKRGQKKVKVRWFHHSREVKGIIPNLNPHPREVLMTPNVQTISAECIDGPATVLTPKHYEKCLNILSNALLAGIFMCFRQFKNSKVKPFSLCTLRGYANQAIISSLDFPLGSKNRSKGHKSNGEEYEDFTHDDSAGRGAKRNRSCGGNQLEATNCGATNSVPGKQTLKYEPSYKKLKIKLSSKGTSRNKLAGPQLPTHTSFKVDEKIELLCQDSGLRGCWFRCKVLQASPKRLKVQYIDVLDSDESANLEEWVPASRVAAPDKLGMRCQGRLTIRPSPLEASSDFLVEVGAPVDAWWSDGWWEGIVTGVNLSGNGSVNVYVPGDDQFLTLEKKLIRTSRDWVDNTWVDIKARADILEYISSNVTPRMKSLKCSALSDASECGLSASLYVKVLATIPEAVEEAKQNSSGSGTHNDQEYLEDVDLMKRVGVNRQAEVEDEVEKDSDTGGDDAGKEAKSVSDT